jgi:hypothetical protein
LVARRIGSSLLRQTFGARRGKRRGPVAQAGPKEQQRKKSGPRRRFSGARRIDDFGALREEQEPDGERRRKSSPGRIWRRETEQRQRDLRENSIRKERWHRGFVRSTNTGGGASPRKTRIGRRHWEQTRKKTATEENQHSDGDALRESSGAANPSARRANWQRRRGAGVDETHSPSARKKSQNWAGPLSRE